MPVPIDDVVLAAAIAAVAALIGAAISSWTADRDSRRDAVVDAAQATADQAAADAASAQAKANQALSVAALSQQVIELTQQVTGLDKRVQRLESENELLTVRLTASFRLIRELIEWVGSGCLGPLPRPHESIADDVDLSDLSHVVLSEN